MVTLRLAGDCFVDYVLRRDNDARKEVLLPGRAVAAAVEQDAEWGGIPFSGLYQHEYRDINRSFPYQSLTLGQLGVPARDILPVTAETGDYYMELGEA